MNKFEALTIFVIGVVLSACIMFVAGQSIGARNQQSTIVEECSKYNVYTDRRLFMRCEVLRPVDDVRSTS